MAKGNKPPKNDKAKMKPKKVGDKVKKQPGQYNMGPPNLQKGM